MTNVDIDNAAFYLRLIVEGTSAEKGAAVISVEA